MALPKLNYTQIPNIFIDVWMRSFNPSVSTVFFAICRKTIGWHKETDSISLSQIEELTGCNEATVTRALHILKQHDLIKVDMVSGKASQFTLNIETYPPQNFEGDPPLILIGDPPQNLTPTKETIQKKDKESVSTPDGKTSKNVPLPAITFNFQESLWYGITDEQVSLWEEAYPAVDVELELRQMGEWCKANGARGKKQNWRKFVVNWLKRSQDRGGSIPRKVAR